MTLDTAKRKLQKLKDPEKSATRRSFFKHCKNDVFLGINTADLRKIAKEYSHLSLIDIRTLMRSPIHDENRLAHMILCLKYVKGDEDAQTKIYHFYIKNRGTIKDWDGVDNSAPYIVGRYLLDKDKAILYTLADSQILWDRRIAMVSTWWFIRNNQFTDTLKLAKLLLKDKEDLIHKAVGWMLREVGKRDEAALKRFLKTHHKNMPRTTLRYAIERFNEAERKRFLLL